MQLLHRKFAPFLSQISLWALIRIHNQCFEQSIKITKNFPMKCPPCLKVQKSLYIAKQVFAMTCTRHCDDIFLKFSFTSISSFFTHIETKQSEGGAKTGVPGEKPPDTSASRTWLVPHVNCAPCEARTHCGEMIERSRALKSVTFTTRPRGPQT